MTDRDRVSEDELRHDDEQMRLSELYEEYQRAAEDAIGNLEDMDPVIDGIENADDIERMDLLEFIRTRDAHKIGEIVLRMLKAELISAMGD
jgi:pyoverdine/dityrosine biosynthesis protein Dit1